MAEEVKSEDVVTFILIGVALATFSIIWAIVTAIVNVAVAVWNAFVAFVTSWWIIPVVIGAVIVMSHLYPIYEKSRQKKEWDRLAQEAQERRFEQQRQERAEAQRRSAYNRVYQSFQFVLQRSPAEARVQLERLRREYPDLIRFDARLDGDYRKLLKIETRQAKDRAEQHFGLS